MAQISKYVIRKDVADRIFEIFLKAIVRVSDEKEAEEFVASLFTPTERIMLAKRLAIAFLLEKGYPYRTIQKVLRVSLATVGFVNFVRQYDNPAGYKKIIGKILREEKLEKMFKDVVKALATLPAQTTKGGGAWRSLKMELEKQQKKRNAI